MIKKVRAGSGEEPLAKTQNGNPGMKEKWNEWVEVLGQDKQEIIQLPDGVRRWKLLVKADGRNNWLDVFSFQLPSPSVTDNFSGFEEELVQ